MFDSLIGMKRNIFFVQKRMFFDILFDIYPVEMKKKKNHVSISYFNKLFLKINLYLKNILYFGFKTPVYFWQIDSNISKCWHDTHVYRRINVFHRRFLSKRILHTSTISVPAYSHWIILTFSEFIKRKKSFYVYWNTTVVVFVEC